MGTCARAGLFAVLGTVLATFGHYAVAESTVPWRLAGGVTAAQFAVIWPLARRRYTPVATAALTLTTQGVLHLVLSAADGHPRAPLPGHIIHAGHSDHVDGHSWHHAGAAMTTAHVVAALIVAWLLHRADARMSAALSTLGTLTRAAVAALAQVLPRPVRDTGPSVFALPGHGPARTRATAQSGDDALEYTVVRRGPPRTEVLRSLTGP